MRAAKPSRAVKRCRFGRIRTRLAVLYASLFAVAMLLIAGVAQELIARHAEASVRDQLAASGTVYERLWTLRSRTLGDSATVLTRDFGFRAAVASGDRPTIASAIANLRARAGVSSAYVVTEEGAVIGDGDDSLHGTVAALPDRLQGGRQSVVVASGRSVYRLVAAPVLAPTTIGWVVFAVRVDGAELRGLERLSSIPLTATILRRTRGGQWVTVGASADEAPSTALDAFVGGVAGGATAPGELTFAGHRTIALARPLASPDGKPEAALLLTYPLTMALAPYRALEGGILGAGLLGLALVLWGSLRLADGIARPIAALDAAARALEDGGRTEVEVSSADEIGRLAESFNRMSAGILEREHRIAHMAFHDTLTGLPNRVLFRQQLELALARALPRNETVAVLCLDLDGFKGVNDTLGHPVGDALLRSVAALLHRTAPGEVVARLGGDEFAVIVDAGADADRPRVLAQAIIDELRAPLAAESHRIATATSIGIALAPGDGRDPETLLKQADLALYRAKQDGRGVFRYFEPALDEAARKRRQMELDLREALLCGQLRLAYQPIYDLKSDRVSGFEALMRWEHPTRGAISPAEFIPVAEDTGLIVAMGEWALHDACRQAASWPAPLRVAVNVSPLQFRSSGFASVVLQALGRSGLPPQRLEIEITESVFLDGVDTTLETLHRLRSLGIRIALDDFGTGYSSLSYLQRFPFDKLKIDRAFVMEVARSDSAAAIVHAIVDLAQALKMETTAEGVEDEAQLACLRTQGCSSVQGFVLSRPLEVTQIAGVIQRDRTDDAPAASRPATGSLDRSRTADRTLTQGLARVG